MWIKGKWYSESEAQSYVEKLESKVAERDNLLKSIRSYYRDNIAWVDLFEEQAAELLDKDNDVPATVTDKNVGGKCSCWQEGHWYSKGCGTCLGTKDREPCNCGGDVRKCDFYPEKRGVVNAT